MPTLLRWCAVIGSALLVLAFHAPSGITAESWRLFAIFVATIVGSVLRPVPAGAVVFLGVTAIALTNTLPPAKALGGYADPIVWLVLCAFFMSRGVLKTGLGRRIAFLFIRTLGKSSLGLAYALGGFKWSSQHLTREVCDGAAKAVACRSSEARQVTVAWTSSSRWPRAATAVLGRDRGGPLDRRGRRQRRRPVSRWSPLVSEGRRHATIAVLSIITVLLGALPVLC